MTGLILAFQFLTRIPTPQVRNFDDHSLSRSSVWFPVVGLVIGALVAWPLYVVDSRPLVAGWLSLLLWVAVTGALHLDGLGDVADAFGAAHRDPERFLEVLKDPHMGVFGVVSVLLQLITKLVLLVSLVGSDYVWAVLLIPAWTRWLTLVLSRYAPPIQPGLADRFAWQIRTPTIMLWALALGAASIWLAPALLLAIPLSGLVTVYWRRRIGGISGDCLGASIEVCESLLLGVLLISLSVAS